LNERRVGRFEVNAGQFGLPGQLAQVLTQGGDVSLLLQGGRNGAPDFLERARLPRFALQDFDDVQTEAGMNEAWQHTDFAMSEDLPGKLRRALGRSQPAQMTTVRPARAIRLRARGFGKLVFTPTVVDTAHIQ